MAAPSHIESLEIGARWLHATLEVPAGAQGVVVFAHGCGSGRDSPRNRFVAGVLQRQGLATLRMDLLTEDEALDRRCVFDVRLLGDRVLEALDALAGHRWAEDQPVGLFGASTGAAAALYAAAMQPERVAAVVSRGGRPDLASPLLPQVQSPTLLIVGADDVEVLALNRSALAALGGPKRLVVVPGATHLFEEPGALEAVAGHAADWFATHLRAAPVPR